MRANLRNGKLIAPESIEAAVKRQQQLAHELHNITTQIDDPARALRATNLGEYDTWLTAAKRARAMLAAEASQLADWLAERETGLFRDAYELLKTLQRDLGNDLDANELALIKTLDAYFARENPRRTP